MKKKMFKKQIAGCVACLLAAAMMLAGCGNGSDGEDANNQQQESNQQQEDSQQQDAPQDQDDAQDQQTPETDGEVGLTDGIYTYVILNEGQEVLNLIHFYDNGVFYYSKYGGASIVAGFYEVDETPCEIYTVGGVTGEVNEATVACDAKITFYDMSGTEVVAEAGYVDDKIIGFTLQDSRDFAHDLNSGHTAEDEAGVSMAEFYLEDDEYSMVAIMHNGTFNDTISSFISGTWTKDGAIYTLTNDMDGTTYTMTDNGDGTAAYVGPDGTEVTLYGMAEAELMVTMYGSTEAAYGTLEITLNGYDDGSMEQILSYAGYETVVTGTWEMASDYSHLTIVFDGVEYEAPLNYDIQLFEMEFPANDGVQDLTVKLEQQYEQ